MLSCSACNKKRREAKRGIYKLSKIKTEPRSTYRFIRYGTVNVRIILRLKPFSFLNIEHCLLHDMGLAAQ